MRAAGKGLVDGMVVHTKEHGDLEVDEKELLQFPHGLYGFEDFKRFVLLEGGKQSPFMWLQCADSREPRFVVTDPNRFVSGYRVPPAEAAPLVGLESEGSLRILAITTVTAGAKEVYVNLKCPIVVNLRDHVAAQVILDEEYPLRFYLHKEG